MIIDRFLMFTGSSAAAPTDSPTTGTEVSTNVIDLGVDSGIPSSANGGGARDIGIGDDPSLELWAQVTTAFADGTSLQAQLQGAPDNGAGAPGSYVTMWTGEAVLEAALVAGAYLANVTVPRTVAGQVPPRFLRMRFITVGTHTAGAVEAGIVLDRQDPIKGAGGALSGYPAGINVAN